MISMYSVLRNWNHLRWRNSKLYSTFQQNPLSSSNIVSTNISIAKYSREGKLEIAPKIFDEMPMRTVVTYNTMISGYSKWGKLEIARKIFDEMPMRTVVTYNTMISGYSKWGKFEDSLDIFMIMHRSCVKLNDSTFSSIFSVCSRLGSLCDGQQIHCLVLKSGFEHFKFVGSSLLNFYAACYEIDEAKKVFDVLHDRNGLLWTSMIVGYVHCDLIKDAMELFKKMPVRDVVSWTTLISCYSRSENECKEALRLLKLMTVDGQVRPNEYTFDSVLRACNRLGVLHEGKMVHAFFIKCGFEIDQSVCGAMIEFYCGCNIIDDAKRVYQQLSHPCLNTSNSLIGGLVSMGWIDEAEIIFHLIETNPISCNIMIKGYALSGRIDDSKRLFDEMPEKTIGTSNTMISVYSRNGELGKAFELFEQTKQERSPATWNSMLSAYIENDQPRESLKLYVEMHSLPVQKNRSTFSTLFYACSFLGSLEQGKLFHAHLSKTPFESNVYVGTSLADMYAKCGKITDARVSFTNISSPNVASWTSIINGYAYHGLGREAILFFNQMLDRGVYPNAVTFVGLLLACVHSGMVDEGTTLFSMMKREYGIEPTLEHYCCVVDLLGRAGHLKDAENFISGMPLDPDWIIWGSLLRSCWSWMDLETGVTVAEKLFKLDVKQITPYVIMSNIYAAVGKWGKVAKVRKKLRSMKLKKDPGCSWVEVKNNLHAFCVEDRTHPQCNDIYTTLEDLTKNVVRYEFKDNHFKEGLLS